MPEIVAEAEMVPVVGSRGCDIALTLPAASVALAANTYVPVSRTFWVCLPKYLWPRPRPKSVIAVIPLEWFFHRLLIGIENRRLSPHLRFAKLAARRTD
jgi:hypothetical protein